MPAPCKICCNSTVSRTVAELVAAGTSDQKISDQIADGIGRMAVSRHRRNHIAAPAKALAEAAGKGREAVDQRAQMMAAAEAGDPAAFVALAGIVADLRKVHGRLERTADAAEQDNQRLAVASLSAQQLRATEVRAKLGGIGGYAAQKATDGQSGQAFQVNISFSDRSAQRISFGTADRAPLPVIDADLTDGLRQGDDGEDDVDGIAALSSPSPALARLAHAFGARVTHRAFTGTRIPMPSGDQD